MKTKKALGTVFLLITAFIWGSSFVSQSDAMKHIKPFTMNALRSLLSCVFLLILAAIFSAAKKQKFVFMGKADKKEAKKAFLGGLACGVFLTGAMAFQQFGIAYTTVGRAGFITVLYIVIVPVIGLFIGIKPEWNAWVSLFPALAGFALMCLVGDDMSLSKGDLLVLICAVFFAFHIISVDKFARDIDGVWLSLIQFAVCCVVSGVLALIFERPNINDILAVWFPIFYAGVFSSGIAYTLQIFGQKYVEPQLAVLLMSLESVFAGVSAFLFRGQKMSGFEIAGSALVFVAVVFAQLDFKKFKKQKLVAVNQSAGEKNNNEKIAEASDFAETNSNDGEEK